MTRCAQCAGDGSQDLCEFHHASSVWDGWAAENRVLCDLIHRGIAIPRLPREQRDDVPQPLDDPSWA